MKAGNRPAGRLRFMDIRSEGISRIDRSDRHEVSRLFQHTLQAHDHLYWRGW